MFIQTTAAIQQLNTIPDRKPGMRVRFPEGPEKNKIWTLRNRVDNMGEVWDITTLDSTFVGVVSGYIKVIKEKDMGEATRLIDFPDLEAGQRFEIMEGAMRGKKFTLAGLYQNSSYWQVNLEGVEGEGWAVLDPLVEVKKIEAEKSVEQDSLREIKNHLNHLSIFEDQIIEVLKRQEEYINYFGQQLNILMDIAVLSMNTDNLPTIKKLITPLTKRRFEFFDYQNRSMANAAKSEANSHPVQNEKDRAEDSKEAGADLTRPESSTPDSIED